MPKIKRLPINFSKSSYIFLDYLEMHTRFSILKAILLINLKDTKKYYSMTRLVKKANQVKSHKKITETRIRRMIAFLIGQKSPLIKIRQSGRHRNIEPTKEAFVEAEKYKVLKELKEKYSFNKIL